GDRDDHPGGQYPLPLAEQTIEAGDADVVESVYVISHHFGGHGGLFRHGYVRRTCRRDQNDTIPWGNFYTPRDDTCLAVIRCVVYDLRNIVVGRFISSGHEQAVAALDDRLRNRCHLSWGLALTVDHLGESLTRVAVVIDAGEAEIFRELDRHPLLGSTLGVGRI